MTGDNTIGVTGDKGVVPHVLQDQQMLAEQVCGKKHSSATTRPRAAGRGVEVSSLLMAE